MIDDIYGMIFALILGAIAGMWFTLLWSWTDNSIEEEEYKLQIEQLEQERDTYKQLVLDKILIEE